MENIEQLKAQLEQLRLENANLKSKGSTSPKTSLKVTDKGGVSLYGLGRFPVTLYASQWEKLLSKVEDIKTFIKDNESKLAKKEVA
jgi:hypothetical protein